MASIEPQIFATLVTGGIALLSYLGESIGARRADTRSRRTIADASSLVTFYRDWHRAMAELRQGGDSTETHQVVSKLAAVECDVSKVWEHSRRKADGRPLLQRIKFPTAPLTFGGHVLHAAYYMFLLAIVWIIVAMAIGVSDPNETTEDVSPGSWAPS